MKRYLRNLSIKKKLILLATASGCVALILCCIGFATNDVRMIRDAKLNELHVQADILGFNSTAVLTFQDAMAADRLLRSLKLQPTIEFACLYDTSGMVLASYQGDPQVPREPPRLQPPGHKFSDDGQLELFEEVLDGNEVVGTLYMCSNMDDLDHQFFAYGKVAALVAFLSLTAAVIFSFVMQQTISGPILRLTETAKRISAEGNYSIRLPHDSQDESGTLIEAFNHMLDQVQVSKAELQLAHDELEDRVRQRTSELQAEIAQHEETQVELVRARDAAETANRSKSQFLANMSHEIRTPLNAVLGFTQLLRRGADGGDEQERQEYLETIHTSGKHLLSLINDILDLSKIESGKLEIEQVRCSPHEVIAEVISVLRVRAQEQGLTLEYEWPEGVPETIQTDPSRVRQLLMNLVGNAIKFTRQGGVTVVARLMHLGSEAQLALEVIDTGIGIPRDKLERVFDPFVQADNSVTREFGGTGLGLAICRRIVESLGGSLTVTSEVGRGSVFTATIDVGSLEGVRILDSPPSDGVRDRTSIKNAYTIDLRAARILLVEDGDTNRKLISLILRRAGARVTTASNGKIGVDLAIQTPFDLILMDMQMPIMDGYTATMQLRQHGVEAPIVALTAHAMKGDSEKCTQAGCTGYLTKPVDADELLYVVAEKLLGIAEMFPVEDAEEVESVMEKAPVSPSTRSTEATLQTTLSSSLPVEDPDFREIVEEFVERLAQKLAEMNHAVSANEMQSLWELAHWLKGAGGTAGFQILTEWAIRLGDAAKSGQTESAREIVAGIAALAARIEVPTGGPI